MKSPNFPENLSIKASAPSNRFRTLKGAFQPDLQDAAIEKFGIAGRVWEASYVLDAYINPAPDTVFDIPFRDEGPEDPVCILELGSGSGFVASTVIKTLRSQGDTFIATDLPEVCSLLQANLHSECRESFEMGVAHVSPLPWGDLDAAKRIYSTVLLPAGRKLTHIVCSDLVYFPELLAPLLRTLLHLSSPNFTSTLNTDSPRIVISYRLGSLTKETTFWSAFGLWFRFTPLLRTQAANEGEPVWQRFDEELEGPIFIFIAYRRQESLQWIVPVDDTALLLGHGAYGTMTSKSDDTFEQLLMMALEPSGD